MSLKIVRSNKLSVLFVLAVALVLWMPNVVQANLGDGQKVGTKEFVQTGNSVIDLNVITGLNENLVSLVKDFLGQLASKLEQISGLPAEKQRPFRQKYFQRVYALLELLASQSQEIVNNPRAKEEAKAKAQRIVNLLGKIKDALTVKSTEFSAELILDCINEFLLLASDCSIPAADIGVLNLNLVRATETFLSNLALVLEKVSKLPASIQCQFKQKYFQRVYALLEASASSSQEIVNNPRAKEEAKAKAQLVVNRLSEIKKALAEGPTGFNAELERRLFGYIEDFLQLVGVRAGSEAQRVGSNSGVPRTEKRIPEKQPSVSPATTPSAKPVPQMVERREGAPAAPATESVQQTTPRPSTPEQPADSSSTTRSTPEVHQEQSDDRAERPLSSSRRSAMNYGLIARLGDENVEVILGAIESVYAQLQNEILELKARLSNRNFALDEAAEAEEKIQELTDRLAKSEEADKKARDEQVAALEAEKKKVIDEYPKLLKPELFLGLAYVNLAEGWLEVAQGVSDRLTVIDIPKTQLTDNLTVLRKLMDKYIQLLNKKVSTKEALQHMTIVEDLKKEIDEFLEELEQAEIEIIQAIRDAEIRRIKKESKEESDTGSRAKNKKVVRQVEEGTPVYPRRIPHGSTLTDWIYEGIQQLEKDEAQIRRLKARLAAARKDEKEIQLTLAISQEQIEQLQEEKGKNKAEIYRLTQELEVAQDRIAALEKELKDTHDTLKTRDEKIEAIQGALEEEKKNAERLREELEERKKAAEEQRAELEAAQSKAKEAGEKLREVKTKAEGTEERLKAAEAEHKRLEQELEKVRMKMQEELEASKKEADQEKNVLTVKVAELQKTLDAQAKRADEQQQALQEQFRIIRLQ